MLNPGLNRPWTEPCYVLSLAHRDRPVLMPHNFPIGIGSLIEEDATHGKRFLP
jgi:hypothetical protein